MKKTNELKIIQKLIEENEIFQNFLDAMDDLKNGRVSDYKFEKDF